MDGGFSYGYNDQIAEPIGSYAYHGNVVPVATSTNLSPITTLRFDPYQELLWSGNEFGRVASSFGPTLADYTAFVVGQVPVREIEVTEDLVLTVGGSAFSGFKREGLLQFVHCSPHFENLTCAHRLPIAPNSILLGGLQNKIVQMDLSTLQEQRIVPLKQADCLMIRSNENALFTTDSKGNITMRSMNTVEAVNSAPAHAGGVTDFEVMGDQLVTCGYSGTTRYGAPFSDPFLKVYDVRNFGSFVPLSVSFPPFLCRFLGFDGDNRMVVLSKYGHLTIVDIQTMQVEPLYQFFEACVPTTLAISSSAQAIALGDPAGCVHFLADRDDPLINLNSYMTTFPVMVKS
ncbi:hypothetical protein AAVH_00578 [Aphelenchoides avenae]|nr:hypothetical protein AAVH_00578 [Aphelenchus avenae]